MFYNAVRSEVIILTRLWSKAQCKCSHISINSPWKIFLLWNLSQKLYHFGRITPHYPRKTSWSLSLLKEQSWLDKSMQFSIVDVASFWAAVWPNIAGNHPIHGQTKIFELFRSRGHFGTLNPSLAAIKSFVFQQSKQHFQTFWLEVEVLCCRTESLFQKAWWTKEPGEEVDRSPSPTPTKASFVSTNDHWSVNKNSKVKLKIYDAEFEIWRSDWWNAASEYWMQNWHLSQM